MGALFRERQSWARAADSLRASFGPLGKGLLEFPFDWTDYYGQEMGEGLRRVFVSFQEPVGQDALAEVKEEALRLEEEFSEVSEGRRRRSVNLDPGILDLDRLVLASAKNFSHRICLRGGIFAEVELIYRNGSFQPLPWTYPDYRKRETLAFFGDLRRQWHLSHLAGMDE
jgi:hypothetical protein